ncbi:undecaprenyl-phosphate glucose phosphotransferase [Rhodopseudomonas sp. NSM]|uniref:undecaprenyl-phosphate glucose phosphotransferase n=1 Tax=Rhodopseudomonas sp. NSM TaxID=3457630 RepID=UPI004036CC9C
MTDAIHLIDADRLDADRPAAGSDIAARPRLTLPFGIIGPALALADSLIIVAAGALGGSLYQQAIGGDAQIGVYAGLGLVASLVHVLAAHRLGLYKVNGLLERQPGHGRVGAAWCFAILVLAVILFMLKSGNEVSRGAIVCMFVLGCCGLLWARRFAKRRLRAALAAGAIAGRRAFVVGTQAEMARFSRSDLLCDFGLDEVDRVALPRTEAGAVAPERLSQRFEAVTRRIRESAAEEIVLALAWSNTADLELLLDRLRVFPLPVRLLPDCSVSAVLDRQNAAVSHLYMVELQRPPLTALERSAKRLLDVTVAATALVLLSPVLLMAAIAIKLESSGPVIFRQRRHGFNGKPFLIYKLRSMRVQEDGQAVVQAARQDPRVTRVGRILRESSIDELPQLVNVLQGNMSIVGPRPHALVHDHEYGRLIESYAFRHHVKPGITGWAQVQGCRGGTPRLELMERRVALDLWYIDNWSLALDIHIMLKTCFELIRRRNAY